VDRRRDFMKIPKGKLTYYKVQKPTRFKAFDIIVDSYKEVQGFVAKEANWVGVFSVESGMPKNTTLDIWHWV